MKSKMYKLIIGFSVLLSQISTFADLPEPYKSINYLPFDNHGWFMNSAQLDEILKSHKPKIVIEIGSWLGSSTRFIASNIDGVLYSVDTWAGSPDEAVHMQDPRLPYLYQLFLSNVKHAHLCEKIIPIRMDSLEAAKALNVKADLIYIDAGHSTESVFKDIIAWNDHLNVNGVLCGDDWGWLSVREGVFRGAHKLNKQIYAEDNFWRLY